MSVAPISQLTRHLHLAYTLKNDYVIAITLPDRIRLHNVADFQPRQRPPFPLDETDGDEVAALSRLHLDEEGDDSDHVTAPIAPQKTTFSPPLDGQDIIVPEAEDSVQAATFGCHGQSLMALGANGRIWIWTNAVD